MAIKNWCAGVFILALPTLSVAGAPNTSNEDIQECSAKLDGVNHSLKVFSHAGIPVAFSYASSDPSTGDTCEISARKGEKLPIGKIDWDAWPNAALVQFIDAPPAVVPDVMRAVLLKIDNGYQLSIQPEARPNYCGLHGYIVSTVRVKAGNRRCVLFDQK